MDSYPRPAVERAMKIQEVILRAMARKITWWQAAEIIGINERTMRRWKERYEEEGYDGLFDRRLGKPSPKRVPVKTVQEVLRLYQAEYHDFSVRHFQEKLVEEHEIGLSYTWVKQALQGAGLVKKGDGYKKAQWFYVSRSHTSGRLFTAERVCRHVTDEFLVRLNPGGACPDGPPRADDG